MSKNRFKRNCEYCGEYYEGEGKRFCSSNCYNSWFKKNYIPKRAEAICKNCLKSFPIKLKDIGKRIFCSIKCRAEYVRKNGSPKRIYPAHCRESTLKTKYGNLKRRSQDKGVDCLSSKQFIKWYGLQPKICYYCGIPVEVWERIYKNSQFKFGLTIDRKDANGGYIENNMVLCCGHCNVVKNNILDEEEMLDVGSRYIKPKWQNKLKKESMNEVLLG